MQPEFYSLALIAKANGSNALATLLRACCRVLFVQPLRTLVSPFVGCTIDYGRCSIVSGQPSTTLCSAF